MTADRYQQIKQIFQAALDLPPGERESYIRGAAGGDGELLRDVAALFRESEHSGLVDRTLSDILAAALTEPNAPAQEHAVGQYRLSRLVGKGGMGAVYEGWRADNQFRQRVAVKLIRRGMDSDFVVERFRQERQILANLNHAGIARLLDGGITGDGAPYLVMEYVEGAPIDEYCRERRLGVRERLRLFCDVCRAVEYAHQNLVVHRDLKPSNILVNRDGAVKLLDFGIAKLVGDDEAASAPATQTGVRLMTPDYAGPEQVLGQPITTAADVYSLGVILYELLAGQRPFQLENRSLLEVQRIVLEQEPVRPSTAVTAQTAVEAGEPRPEPLRRALSGELDNIVLMALRKEPERRYASVEQLRADIEAHLNGLPVRAQGSTLRYRASKALRRHRTVAAAAAIVLITLVTGIVVTTREAQVARSERARAERRFNDVRRLANAFLFDVHDSIQNLAGSTPAREQIVRHAQTYLDSLAGEAAGDASLQRELASAYIKLGDVQGHPSTANLGDLPGALASYRRAQEIFEAIWARQPDDPGRNRDASRVFSRLGEIQSAMGDTAGALASHRRVLELDQADAAARPSDLKAQLELASSYSRLATTLADAGNLGEAVTLSRRSLELRERLASTHTDDAELLDSVAVSYNDLGVLSLKAGATADGIEYQKKSLAIRERRSAERPHDARLRRSVAVSMATLGDAQAQTGDLASALESVRKAEQVFEALAAADPKDSRAQRDLALTYKKAGDLLTYLNRPAEAIAVYRRAVSIREDLVKRDPANATWLRDLMVVYNDIGDALGNPTFPNLGDRAGALAQYRRGLTLAERLAKDDAGAESRADLWVSYNKIGQMVELAGDASAALAEYKKGYALMEALAKEDASNTRRGRELAISHELIGRLLTGQRDFDAAQPHLEQSAAQRERLASLDPEDADLCKDVALAYGNLGDLFRGKAERAPLAVERRELAAAAAGWYERSEQEWRRLRERKVMLDSAHTDRAAEIARHLQWCRTTLAKP
ncbi:MAG: serine/threonine protein kinase [Bryobacteraceae bacterium]|nr:serine/threonine protein kinase [Bryobacteraceae bacterium]